MSKKITPMPEILGSDVVYQGYFDVIIDTLKVPHHPKEITYSKLNLKSHAAAIIAITKEGLFVVTREYRHPLKKWVLGCPGGKIDPGESPLEAAKRELLEETGYETDTLCLLGSIYPLPAVTDQQIFYILATNVTLKEKTSLEPLEMIHTELKSQEELFQEIFLATSLDGVFCTGLLLYHLHHNSSHTTPKLP